MNENKNENKNENDISNSNSNSNSNSSSSIKEIIIIGAQNQITKKSRKNTKRVEPEKWELDSIYFTYEKQIEMIQQLKLNIETGENNTKNIKLSKELKILKQQIERKINSYKQQDNEKNMYEPNLFVDFQNVIDQLIQCNLKCYYCNSNMALLYEIVRENKQWSIDRINNDLGHNKNNYVISCLECNLKRRRQTSEKFLFTKQLVIVKKS